MQLGLHLASQLRFYDPLLTGGTANLLFALSPACRAMICPCFGYTEQRKAGQVFEMLCFHPRATACTASLLLGVGSSP